MEKIDKNKLILPVAIVIGCFILGGFYYYSQINKQSYPQAASSQKIENLKENSNSVKLTNIYTSNKSTLPTHDLFCIPNKKSYCTIEGCEDVEANVFVLLGKNSKGDGLFMARCDNKPCDIYDVKLSESGMFLNFDTVEPHGLLFKMSTIDKSFLEVITLGTDSFISHGYCYSK